jgi:hypothetical protein
MKNLKLGKKISETVKTSSENGARRQLVEELFYDLNRSRLQIYRMNFVRGVFFGFGTVLGGTVVVAFIVWILGQFAGWFPSIGYYIHQIIIAIQHAK